MLKALVNNQSKGPRKTKIAVFKLHGLSTMDWFKDDGMVIRLPELLPAPTPARRTIDRTPKKGRKPGSPSRETNETQADRPEKAIDDDVPKTISGASTPQIEQPILQDTGAHDVQSDKVDLVPAVVPPAPVLEDETSRSQTVPAPVAENADVVDDHLPADHDPEDLPNAAEDQSESDALPDIVEQEAPQIGRAHV